MKVNPADIQGLVRDSRRLPMPEPSAAPRTVVHKRDLTLQLSDQTGLKPDQVRQIISLFTANLTGHLARGRRVEFRGFGSFKAKVAKAKTGRNPKDPAKPVPIAARAVVRFTPAKAMKEGVLLLTPGG